MVAHSILSSPSKCTSRIIFFRSSDMTLYSLTNLVGEALFLRTCTL
jgi:hypothetical protein